MHSKTNLISKLLESGNPQITCIEHFQLGFHVSGKQVILWWFSCYQSIGQLQKDEVVVETRSNCNGTASLGQCGVYNWSHRRSIAQMGCATEYDDQFPLYLNEVKFFTSFRYRENWSPYSVCVFHFVQIQEKLVAILFCETHLRYTLPLL